MYKILLLLFTLCCLPLNAQQIALTFDDAPRGDGRVYSGEERTTELIANLKKAEVPSALFFVTAGHIKPANKPRIDAYISNGHFVANHSHQHLSANRDDITMTTYLADIDRAHQILSQYDNFMPLYRFPYLHEGNTISRRDSVRDHLAALGYQNGYVTVDNYDWYMERLLQQALRNGKTVNFDKLKTVYVNTLWETIQFYDNISKKHLGRSVKHVLLLHENDLAAMFVDDLVFFLREQGWEIITPQEAFTDPIARQIPDVLYNNQGRVAALANAKGIKPAELWHPSESEEYLEALFRREHVFSEAK